MRRPLSIAVLTALLLVLCSSVAAGKGPTALTITGDGLDQPIEMSAFGSSGEPGSGGHLSRIAEHGGLFATVFGVDGSGLETQRPDGDLGPALTLTWTVPMGDARDHVVVQRLHPWAAAGPVTHTEGGQQHFGSEIVGGWYAGGQELAAVLSDIGIPDEPPTRDTTRAALGVGGMITVGLVLLMAQHAARRRRGAMAAPA